MNEKLLFENLFADKRVGKAIREKSLSHAILFVTPDHVLSKKLIDNTAKKLLGGCDGCRACRHCKMVDARSHPDYFIYPIGDKQKIVTDDVEEIIERTYYRPFMAKCKVFVLNGLENTNEASQNKLLKIIEEPPENTYFLMSVDNENNALRTVRSRAFQISVDELSSDLLARIIEPDCKSKDEAIAISELSNGSLESAYKNLNKSGKIDPVEISLSAIESLTTTKELLKTTKLFPQASIKEVLPVMALCYRDILCIKNGAEEDVSLKGHIERVRALAKQFSSAALIESIEKVAETVTKIKFNTNAVSSLDTLLLELLEVKYNCPA